MENPNIETLIHTLYTQKSKAKPLLELSKKIAKEAAAKGLIVLPDKGGVRKLLEEYNLEGFLDDLYFLACQSKFEGILFNYIITLHKDDIELIREMLQALKLLHDYDTKELKIEIKHKHLNESATIQHEKIIHVINETIKREYLNNDEFLLLGHLKPEDIQGKAFGEYMRIILDESILIRKSRGAKRKHIMTGKIIDEIQCFLQNRTSLKAEEGVDISRGQALFIYDMLDFLGLIHQQMHHKERNIRHILKNYRAEKEQEEINFEKQNKMQAAMVSKIKNINRKK
jgi:hypothetical protein